MAIIIESKASRSPALFTIALIVTLSMAVLYTGLDLWQPPESLFALLAFFPGLISVIALRVTGLSSTQLYLRPARVSWPGFGALAATTILLFPILGSTTGWTGWHWLQTLVYAPASGIAQELYFRSALLPGLERALHGRKVVALFIHSAIFIGFHLRTFGTVGSLPMDLIIATVLFLAGCGWGWQVQRDHTVVWSMLQHGLFLMLMSMFAWT